MKKLTLILLISVIVSFAHVATISAAPTSTILLRPIIPSLQSTGNPCLTIGTNGLVSTSTCGAGGGGDMFLADNLAGLASTSTSRTNLGLGSIATFNSGDYLASTTPYYPTSNPAGYSSSSVTGFTDAATSTSANTFTVSTTTSKITITIPPAKDQYFAPSSTIVVGAITTSTYPIDASGTIIQVLTSGNSSTIGVNPNLNAYINNAGFLTTIGSGTTGNIAVWNGTSTLIGSSTVLLNSASSPLVFSAGVLTLPSYNSKASSSITVTGTAGLTGGGDLTSNETISLDTTYAPVITGFWQFKTGGVSSSQEWSSSSTIIGLNFTDATSTGHFAFGNASGTDMTLSGNLGITGTFIYASSTNWDSAYTKTNASSSNWDIAYTRVNASSSNWDLSYTRVNASSSNWDLSYTRVNASSSKWDAGYNQRATTTIPNSATAPITLSAGVIACPTCLTTSTWNINASGTLVQIVNAGGSSTVGINPKLSQYTNDANFITTSTWVNNASGSIVQIINSGGSSTIGINPNLNAYTNNAWFLTSTGITEARVLVGLGTSAATASSSFTRTSTTLNFIGTVSSTEMRSPSSTITNLTLGSTYTALDGRSLTNTAGTLNADAELYTSSISVNIGNPSSTTDSAIAQHRFATNVTLTSVFCSDDTGTSTIRIDRRATSTPNTVGTQMIGALNCGSGGTTSTFAVASSTTDYLLNFNVSSTAGTPTVLRVNVSFTKDD